MSYTIGAVTLPSDTTEVIPRYQKYTQEIPMYVMSPYIADYGSKIPTLTIKGFMTSSSGIEALYTSHINTLIGYITSPAAFPAVLLDESPTADWTAYTYGVGAYSITRAVDTTHHVIGKQSCSLTIGAGGSATVGIQRDYTATGRNWYENDFVSWCWYGSASTQVWRITIEDIYGSWIYYNFADLGSTGWRRFFARKDNFSIGAGTIDWSKIRYVRVTCTPTATSTTYIDRMCVGVGVFVDFPGARYDGIYLMNSAQFPEIGGQVNKVDFLIELVKMDDYYGNITRAM